MATTAVKVTVCPSCAYCGADVMLVTVRSVGNSRAVTEMVPSMVPPLELMEMRPL